MQANYSLEGIKERAEAALAALHVEAKRLDDAYDYAQRIRELVDIPSVVIVGMGRAGKDTAGEFLSEHFKLRPPKSSSLNALPFVAHMIGIDDKTAYAERHQHREFWIEACNQLRAVDLTRLARWCFGQCDLAIGLRGKEEFHAVVRDKVADLTVWIDRDVPNDPTVEFTRDDCDVVIDNHTSTERFFERLTRFGRMIYSK